MKHLIPWKKRDRVIANLHKNFDNLFDRLFSEPDFSMPRLFSQENWCPSVDLSEGKKDFIIKAEIPGVDQKDIDVSLDGRFLTIKGEKKNDKEESGERYHRIESAFGYYKRTIELPTEVDASHVQAQYKNGVLKIRLKKAPEKQTKKVTVRTGD